MRPDEPLEVPMGRTLLALAQWNRSNVDHRLTVEALASADFAIRFPIVLDRLYARNGRATPANAAATDVERIAPENDQLVAQLAAWPLRHRSVVGALVGRGLADLAPAVRSQRVEITPQGVAAATSLATTDGWPRVARRATALSKLGLAPATLIQRCREETHR